MSRSPLIAVSVLVLVALLSTFATAAGPNVLFFGNSFTLNGGSGITIPQLVQRIAVAAGRPQPTMNDRSISGASLLSHLQSNTGVITQGNPTWDFVVFQEYSTKPTSIAGVGNATEFKNNAQSLYGLVKAQSPAVVPVLFETWSRSPKNVAELNSFYPGGATLSAKAALMQSELRLHYTGAKTQIGSSIARVAPVGDSFEAANFADVLYNGDYYHSSNRGALLASLVLYDTLYATPSQPISYASITSALGGLTTPANLGVSNASDWDGLKSLADSVTAVPEPSMVGWLTGFALILGRRHRG